MYQLPCFVESRCVHCTIYIIPYSLQSDRARVGRGGQGWAGVGRGGQGWAGVGRGGQGWAGVGRGGQGWAGVGRGGQGWAGVGRGGHGWAGVGRGGQGWPGVARGGQTLCMEDHIGKKNVAAEGRILSLQTMKNYAMYKQPHIHIERKLYFTLSGTFNAIYTVIVSI